MTRTDVLITAQELLTQAMGRTPPRLLDVRWTQLKPDGRDDFARGPLPHALYVDLDTDLADHGQTDPRAGRHPLPSPEQFQTTVRTWGITPEKLDKLLAFLALVRDSHTFFSFLKFSKPPNGNRRRRHHHRHHHVGCGGSSSSRGIFMQN